jgi:hypothetical protein
MSEGKPIGVAAIDKTMLDELYQIALYGHVSVGGVDLNGFSYMQAAAKRSGVDYTAGVVQEIFVNNLPADTGQQQQDMSYAGASAMFDNRLCLMVIVNALAGTVSLSGDPLLAHGQQTGFPAAMTRSSAGVNIPTSADSIPGALVDHAGNAVYHIGVYVFEKSAGFHGTEGAIAFTTPDPATPKKIGISWCVDYVGRTCVAGTVNLDEEYGSLQALYDNTVGVYKMTYGEGAHGVNLNLTMAPLKVDDQTLAHYQVVVATLKPL